uniref:Nitroreductase. Oxidoreductase activity n=1 Tax=Magnetococcus massalia (strain MO-1) TaxID=451514 RepID=A0A1S7LGB2_MAGMO|nr:Nitroreductase. Oxidoreductase activity [Candidatus Magnetococcus massalia]
MEVLEAIEARRSIKAFDPSYTMSADDIQALMRLTLLSPTAFNIQHWRFVLVQEQEKREEICRLAWGQAQMTEASLLIVLCADLNAWEKEPARYWRHAPQEVQGYLLPAIERFYQNNPEVQRDEAFRSMGIASQTIMLAAKGMGLDSCPMAGFDYPAVAELINLPEDHVLGLIVTVGKALQPARPRGGEIRYDEAVIHNHFKD